MVFIIKSCLFFAYIFLNVCKLLLYFGPLVYISVLVADFLLFSSIEKSKYVSQFSVNKTFGFSS